ncbi:MAG: MBOAT family protein [Acutalibacter sp.]|jgi:alginate O-acetyltransferase complex protein AlgI|uniref:MBOAT family O-acyltransferase n=1 Tax=Acutalibacter sp. TaxID=1918636 RepID=UPI00216EE17B|nr:MBOAT family O-acyltransferase [Acutalibacter sp.]MCI9225440.1 MBOAT family protein [Acutalibacter sp.]
MLFSSVTFLFYFLPVVMALYFISPVRLKNGVLLLASLFFYGWGEPRYLAFMLLSITQGYIFGLLIEKYRGKGRTKALLTASVLFSLLLLGYCKYADFFISNFNLATGLSVPLLKIALPVGISFYTFQVISYTVDVYRGTVPAQRNYVDLAAYIAMFPQLVAGPIVRYADIAGQLRDRTHSLSGAAMGVRRFIIGLSKKVLIANQLGALVAVFKESAEPSVLFYWLYAAAYMLHIYFDFSGYSDMAIGLGYVFGFRFPENFDYPYISRSITEFWRRWHISLGAWFRDYLYIPLGGNRVGKFRWLFNIAVVWAATGLWHGAAWNFALWGLLFAALLMVEKLRLSGWLKRHRVISHIYVLFLVMVSFVIFDAESVAAAFSRISAMFGGQALLVLTVESVYYLKSYLVILALALIGATPMPKKLAALAGKGRYTRVACHIAEPVACLILLTVCTAYLIDGSFNPFLYFRF